MWELDWKSGRENIGKRATHQLANVESEPARTGCKGRINQFVYLLHLGANGRALTPVN
jgi:hypothetical protein